MSPRSCGEALLSVLGQTHADWSLIVVDDGSTDATAAVAASFRTTRIRLVRQDNAGVSAARNRGIRQAESARPDAFLFLDGDDWLAPDALALLADALDSAPWAVAACGRYARVAANGAVRLSPAPPRWLPAGAFADPQPVRQWRPSADPAGGGQAAGDFRDDLFYGEDWEYWTRLALLGEFVAVTIANADGVRARTGGQRHADPCDGSRRLSPGHRGDPSQSRHRQPPGRFPAGASPPPGGRRDGMGGGTRTDPPRAAARRSALARAFDLPAPPASGG